MKTVSTRKQLIRLLGSAGARDYKTQEEMIAGHALYQQLMRNDAKADQEEIPFGKIIREPGTK